MASYSFRIGAFIGVWACGLYGCQKTTPNNTPLETVSVTASLGGSVLDALFVHATNKPSESSYITLRNSQNREETFEHKGSFACVWFLELTLDRHAVSKQPTCHTTAVALKTALDNTPAERIIALASYKQVNNLLTDDVVASLNFFGSSASLARLETGAPFAFVGIKNAGPGNGFLKMSTPNSALDLYVLLLDDQMLGSNTASADRQNLRVEKMAIALASNEVSNSNLAVKGSILAGTWPGLTNGTVQNVYANAVALPDFPAYGLSLSGKILLGNPQEGAQIAFVQQGLNNGLIDTDSFKIHTTNSVMELYSNGVQGLSFAALRGPTEFKRLIQVRGNTGTYTNSVSSVLQLTQTLHTVQTLPSTQPNTTLLTAARIPHPNITGTFISLGSTSMWLENAMPPFLRVDVKDANGNMLYTQFPLSSSNEFPGVEPVSVLSAFPVDFVLTKSHGFVGYTGGANSTVRLPIPTNALGKRYTLMKLGGGNITVNPNGFPINNVVAEKTITEQHQAWTFIAIKKSPTSAGEWVAFKSDPVP